MSRLSRSIAWGFVLLVIAASAAGFWFYNFTQHWLNSPIDAIDATATYEVPRGASLSSVLNDLHARGWMEHPKELALWTRYTQPGFTLRAGEYQIEPGVSPLSLVTLFSSGRVVLHKITIVEGTMFAELRHTLAAEPALKNTLQQLSDNDVLKILGSSAARPEGLLFPDTYRFAKGTPDMDVLRMAYQRMQKEMTRVWSERDANLPLNSAYEALILASIIEKETALASERPMIAGVFVERMRKGMRLQTDPTVIYGLQPSFDGDLRRADLMRDTPYNTYTRMGLPPTPICFPSGAALEAAVHPNQTDALFFVATGDGNGSHHFSRNLEEHNAALQKYLRTLKRR